MTTTTSTRTSESSVIDETERERLQVERDHLLASLDDLDSELAAGDIDELDYETLKNDYTARAAKLTRVLDGAPVKRTKRASSPLGRKIMWSVGVILLAGFAAFAMVEFSGARGANDTASGEIRLSSASLLNDAANEFRLGNVDRAIELYGEVLEESPTNVEAFTYRGWLQYQSGDVESAMADFDDAVAFDPEYGDVRVFRAIVALDAEDYSVASAELAAFDQSNPTAIAQSLVAERQVRERIGIARMSELLEATPGALDLVDLEAEGVGVAEAQLAGELFIQLEDPTQALRSFDSVLEAEPDNADALAWHGWTLALLAESGEEELFADAEDWLERAVTADPNTADARVFRAFLFNRLARPDEAQVELEHFDQLTDPPADMVSLMAQFGLREALEQQ